MTPEQRRKQFISDIVEVCKRHRVMLDVDCLYWANVGFAEANPDKQGMLFNVDIEDIESAVREAVWPIVHGEKK